MQATSVVKRKHPGRGERRARPVTKGRQVDRRAVTEVQELLGDQPRRRDLLIEYLHLIQDRYRQLSAAHLTALAQEMKLALAEVYETATFYAHFDVAEDESPPAVTVRVCDSLTCELMGARELLESIPDKLGPEVRVLHAPCMGRCHTAPTAQVGHFHVDRATEETLVEAILARRIEPVIPEYVALEQYQESGGYTLLRQCISGERSRDDVLGNMQDSGLRGLGGAGFPTGKKWEIVRGFQQPRFMAVNADEGEPGTFKDRHYLERDPHRFLEGMLIAAWVVEADTVYIYLRDEYPAVRHLLDAEITKINSAGLNGHCRIELRRGAGAYICGEESSMLESIEGKRGIPRNRPPFVAEVGLFGRPTLVNNVETLYWVRDIVTNGADWFASQGRNGGKGLRSYSVSGRVRDPGVKLAPAGITARELIDEFCQGMLPGHTFKAYLPGGASGGILPARLADVPLEFGTLDEYGCFVGSHAVMVLSDQDSIKDAVLNLMRFFEDES
ncbi:MAG: NAD(P)H-dependent oxidoreductase subunit E, partial [Gammaproteobacteria bacterium]|nr:NAD(P)H-dependent oxidoreductase subunit E [Gammaproteobacteria bacterium]